MTQQQGEIITVYIRMIKELYPNDDLLLFYVKQIVQAFDNKPKEEVSQYLPFNDVL